MIDDETLAYLGPALLSGSGRALLAQMRAVTELGNLRGGVSVSTPAFCYLIKNKPSSPPLTPQGDSRASTSSLPPPESSVFVREPLSSRIPDFQG